ncbi:hypothetical protein DFJ77DRAFT_437891 [Powellomyces hirtus]|nr:hypothetical protein DFJ77DRAFT_437891 [Powellomyces hirtus]
MGEQNRLLPVSQKTAPAESTSIVPLYRKIRDPTTNQEHIHIYVWPAWRPSQLSWGQIIFHVLTLLSIIFWIRTAMLSSFFQRVIGGFGGSGAALGCLPGTSPIEYTPEPGFWSGSPHPLSVTLEFNGAAAGNINVQSSEDVKQVKTTATFYLSHESLSSKIEVIPSPSDQDDYRLVINTPTSLLGTECIRGEVTLLIPAQRSAPGIKLSVRADNAAIVANDMHDLVQFDTINLNSQNGAVHSKGLQASGPITIGTNNGEILLSHITCRALGIKSHNGRIGLANVNCPVIQARTENGAISTTKNGAIHGDVDAQEGTVEALTQNGAADMTIDGHPFLVRAASEHGGIRLQIADQGFQGEFDATTRIGKVSVTGTDLHFREEKGGPQLGGKKAGWKGDELGRQRVSATTSIGAILLSFA